MDRKITWSGAGRLGEVIGDAMAQSGVRCVLVGSFDLVRGTGITMVSCLFSSTG